MDASLSHVGCLFLLPAMYEHVLKSTIYLLPHRDPDAETTRVDHRSHNLIVQVQLVLVATRTLIRPFDEALTLLQSERPENVGSM